MPKRIIRRAHSPEPFHNCHPLLQRIYSGRKVSTSIELDRSFRHLLAYTRLLHIDKAVLLLSQALMEQQTILIVGDFDADGATSTTLALRALNSFGAKKIHFMVPNRFKLGYGLTPELVTQAMAYSPHLIITVDNGIANHAGVAAAKAKGVNVLITDHHLPGQTLPEADVIINPNQPHDAFPSKNLAGVGVIFYVMLALRRHLLDTQWFEKARIAPPNMGNLLDLVALGTIADLVPLDHNNRILIHQGLARIRAGKCVPGIIALLELAKRNFTQVVAADLGFAVAARLNAAGRMDDMSLGIACLLADDPIQARAHALVLDKLNKERRVVEKDMEVQALSLLNQLTQNLNQAVPLGLCLFDENWHQGVIGILASRIKDRLHRPVIVFAPGPEGELKGSARSINGFHIRDALALMDSKHPHLIAKFGGHAMAAGLTIARHNLDDFSTLFNEVVRAQLSAAQLQHDLLSDGDLNPEEFNVDIAAMLREAGPWGQAFPEPLFDGVFKIHEQRLVADKHLKLRLAKENKLIDAVAFFVDVNQWPNHQCQYIHAAYRLEINEYQGRRTVQLIVEHLTPA